MALATLNGSVITEEERKAYRVNGEPCSLTHTWKTIARKVTAEHFKLTNETFQKWCANAGIPATNRQARKWMNREGIAYQTMKRAVN